MAKKQPKDAPAKPVRLHYVTDAKPGFTRRKRGKHFVFYNVKGEVIIDAETVARIRKLAIPPAYRDVWICPLAHGHLQATGLDAKGRKQYRYHPQWRAEREANKFEHILFFGEKLPAIRKRAEEHLSLPGLPREKVLATVLQLLEKTLIRVGNAEYAKANASYGLTTLRGEHVTVKGGSIRFRFKGKSGKEWNLGLQDKRIAKVLKKCEDIPGQELLKYVDEQGQVVDVTSADVNSYLKDISGEDFTAKDFRTWSATVLATLTLKEYERFDSEAQAKANILRAIETVAKRLGNTPTICRKSYIHPEVINAYLEGEFVKMVESEIIHEFDDASSTLGPEEMMALALLYRRLERKHS